MDSPAKRRKKNDFKGADAPVKSLDFFFGKQKAAAKSATIATTVVMNGDNGDKLDTNVTDEELARRLQAQWDEEDRQRDAATSTSLEPPSSPLGPARDNVPSDSSLYNDSFEDKTGVKDGPKIEAEPVKEISPKKNTLSLQQAGMAEDTVTSNIPFDESVLTFDPQKYIPELRGHWAVDNGLASYALLTRCFILVNSTASRLKIVDTLVNLLRLLIEADPDSLLPAVWLATNSISPPYIDLELGLGDSAIGKALKKVCGLSNASLRSLSAKHGDAGDVAFEAKKKQSFTLRKPKPLTINGVFDTLVKVANSKGSGSVENKQRLVERLVQDARGAEESRYIVRTLVQHLRIGAVKTTMLIALSRAFMLSRPATSKFPLKTQAELASLDKDMLREVYHRNEEIVKACFARRPNYNDLVPALLDMGVCKELLLTCGLSLHIPLRPMLGSITRDLGEMLTKLQDRNFSCEYKYDGQRAQVHCDDEGMVTIFSRHLEVMTDKYPDLVALVPQIRGENVRSFILEGEVVAVDKVTGDLKPFQVLSNRARKDVVIHDVSVNVCLFSFDLMYLNGEELLNRSFRERRDLLRSLFVEIPNHFTWVKSIDATSADSEIVLEFFKSATDIKCEGIMVKVLDNPPEVKIPDSNIPVTLPPTPSKSKRAEKLKAKQAEANGTATEAEKEIAKGGRRKALLSTYEPDKRLDSWLKVKKDYNTSADTIDLIPIGAWHGSGRKNKWWSPILLAVRNPETGQLVAVTKCMSGFTDAFYTANRAKYDPDEGLNVISRPMYVDYVHEPAVWFEPSEVWEVAFADITMSPTYTAGIGLVNEDRGMSLRFPRFLKVRDDKSIDEASTDEFLAELWRKQEAKAPKADTGGSKKGGEDDDDDDGD